MTYRQQHWNDYDETKTETQNIENGSVVTSERMNNIENGVKSNSNSVESLNKDITDIRIKKRDKDDKIKTTDLSPEIIDLINGEKGKGVAPNAVQRISVGTKQIDANRTDFLVIGNNKFDKSKAIRDHYAPGKNGELTPAVGVSVLMYIDCYPGEKYSKNDENHVAFYGYDQKYKSGFEAVKTFTVPKNCYFMSITVPTYKLNTFMLNEGSTLFPYEPYSIKIKDLELGNVGTVFEVYEGSIKFDVENKSLSAKSTNAVYGNKKVTISPKAYPFDAAVIDLTSKLATTDFLFSLIVKQEGEKLFLMFEPYHFEIQDNMIIIGFYDKRSNRLVTGYERAFYKEILDETIKDVFVKNMSEFHQEILKATGKTYVTRVHCYPGIYNTLEPFTDEQIKNTNFFGYRIPDNVDIIGVGGNRAAKFIANVLKFDVTTRGRVSTLNFASVNKVENISVLNIGGRYPIHDDMNTEGIPVVRHMKNVYAFQNWQGILSPAYGAGCRSGAYLILEDCEFISEKGTPFAFHGFKDLTAPFYLQVKNSKLYNSADHNTTNSNYNYSADITCMKSTQLNTVEFIGCDMPDGLVLRAYDGKDLNSTGEIDTKIIGHSNNKDLRVDIKPLDGKDYTSNVFFHDVMSKRRAAESIIKGDMLKLQNGRFVVKTTEESESIGKAEHNAVKGEYVIYKK